MSNEKPWSGNVSDSIGRGVQIRVSTVVTRRHVAGFDKWVSMKYELYSTYCTPHGTWRGGTRNYLGPSMERRAKRLARTSRTISCTWTCASSIGPESGQRVHERWQSTQQAAITHGVFGRRATPGPQDAPISSRGTHYRRSKARCQQRTAQCADLRYLL